VSTAAQPERVILIGFMGSGKTSVGRLLASRLGWDFVDTDAEIETRVGARVTEIFRSRGEAAFRDLEAGILASLRDREGVVIATGGGAPTQRANAAFFSSPHAAVFYLQVSLETALQRTGENRDRPLLARGKDAVRALYEGRLALYQSLGSAVRTDGRTPDVIAAEILELLRSPRETKAPGGSGSPGP
jgi:shikimate kinase